MWLRAATSFKGRPVARRARRMSETVRSDDASNPRGVTNGSTGASADGATASATGAGSGSSRDGTRSAHAVASLASVVDRVARAEPVQLICEAVERHEGRQINHAKPACNDELERTRYAELRIRIGRGGQQRLQQLSGPCHRWPAGPDRSFHRQGTGTREPYDVGRGNAGDVAARHEQNQLAHDRHDFVRSKPNPGGG